MAEASRPAFRSSIITEVENQVVKHVMLFLTDEGRAAPCEYIIGNFRKEKSELYSCILLHNPNWDLIKLLQSRPSLFYYLEHGKDRFVSLSRDYAFFNPRLAKALMNTTDENKEAVIKFDGPSTSEANTNLRHACRFHEYEFAKVALAVLEILDATTRSVSKNRYNVPFKRVTEKYFRMSDLSKSAMHFCADGDFTVVFQNFLELFRPIFQIENSLLVVDFYAYDGLKMSVETDLVWSYIGICICKGMTSIEQLVEEVNRLIDRAKLKLVQKLTSDTLMPMLQCRKDLYFLPGDNTVWLMDLCLDNAENIVRKIQRFFTKYLQRNTVHYTRCLDVLHKAEPSILKEYKDLTSINIASYLYSLPGVFSFEKGTVSLIAESEESKKIVRTYPVSVPTNLSVHSVFFDCSRVLEGQAVVQEVGARSVILRFETVSMEGASVPPNLAAAVIGNHGFGHRTFTTFNDRLVDDFTFFLSVGDKVRAIFDIVEKINIHIPLHITVNGMFSLDQGTSRSLSEYRSPPSYDTNSSDSEDASEKPSPVGACAIEGLSTPGVTKEPKPRKKNRPKKKKKKSTADPR